MVKGFGSRPLAGWSRGRSKPFTFADEKRSRRLRPERHFTHSRTAKALYVFRRSRVVSSLGMSSITSCPHASSSRHQPRSPALA